MSKIMTDFAPATSFSPSPARRVHKSIDRNILWSTRASLLADYSSLLAALSDAKLTKVRDALPPARDLFGDEGAAAFLQTEQSYNVQLPSSASSMGSSPCESRGSSSGLQHRLATQRQPLTGPALGQITPDPNIPHPLLAWHSCDVRCAGTCGSNSR